MRCKLANRLLLTAGILTVLSCGGIGQSFREGDLFEVTLTTTDGSQDCEDFEIMAVPANKTFYIYDDDTNVSSNNRPDWAIDYTASRTRNKITFTFRPREDQVPFTLYTNSPRTKWAYETMAFRITQITESDEDFDEDGQNDLIREEGAEVRFDLPEGIRKIPNGVIHLDRSNY
ncbi:MAG: hypothetical protein WCK51_11735 [Armatimonadota bacterium]